jgi:dTDP-4-dehydrorhamnose 3,5-epimerase
MIFLPTKLNGVFEIRPSPIVDPRGWFARSWCQKEFETHSLNPRLVQCNISFNTERGTLRGMHYQTAPYQEAKLVRCTRGAIYDVAVDLRRESPTFRQWVGVTLTSENHIMLYVPEGCGHGFLTLEQNCEVFYQMSEFYSGNHGCGVRWDDSAFGIDWPGEVNVISDRDRTYPDFQ